MISGEEASAEISDDIVNIAGDELRLEKYRLPDSRPSRAERYLKHRVEIGVRVFFADTRQF